MQEAEAGGGGARACFSGAVVFEEHTEPVPFFGCDAGGISTPPLACGVRPKA
jgi:hypothetical protein